MEFEIDTTSPVHGYRQLADQIAERITSGKYASQIPSLKDLEAESGLSMSTVQHAIRVLKDEGLVYSVPGRGMFVRKETGQ